MSQLSGDFGGPKRSSFLHDYVEPALFYSREKDTRKQDKA